jgi:hypothetical protein
VLAASPPSPSSSPSLFCFFRTKHPKSLKDHKRTKKSQRNHKITNITKQDHKTLVYTGTCTPEQISLSNHTYNVKRLSKTPTQRKSQ